MMKIWDEIKDSEPTLIEDSGDVDNEVKKEGEDDEEL
jgi:hypothetical protein